MVNKKKLIIQAFEQMDAEMLEILLNEDQSYQDVPKETFVNELKKYFKSLKSNDHSKNDFQAYQGKCTKCNIGKTGYAFINSEGHCALNLVFEESEDDFTDIYHCSRFFTHEKKITEGFKGISFYKDDEVNYMPTEKNLREERRCENALAELQEEIVNEGILAKKFYIPWVDKYQDLDDVSAMFSGDKYRYKIKTLKQLSTLRYYSKIVVLENLAKSYWLDFTKFSEITKENIQDWLIACDKDFPDLKFIYFDPKDFILGYYEDGEFKIDSSEFKYYRKINNILNKYIHWIPDDRPWVSIIDEDENEDLLF